MKLTKDDFVYLDDFNFVVQCSDNNEDHWSKEIMDQILKNQEISSQFPEKLKKGDCAHGWNPALKCPICRDIFVECYNQNHDRKCEYKEDAEKWRKSQVTVKCMPSREAHLQIEYKEHETVERLKKLVYEIKADYETVDVKELQKILGEEK